jgi:preprotein translocase subunit SecE
MSTAGVAIRKRQVSIVQSTNSFLQSAWVESKKVTWPSREELMESTRVVVVASFVLMLYLFLVDRVLTIVLGVFM